MFTVNDYQYPSKYHCSPSSFNFLTTSFLNQTATSHSIASGNCITHYPQNAVVLPDSNYYLQEYSHAGSYFLLIIIFAVMLITDYTLFLAFFRAICSLHGTFKFAEMLIIHPVSFSVINCIWSWACLHIPSSFWTCLAVSTSLEKGRTSQKY